MKRTYILIAFMAMFSLSSFGPSTLALASSRQLKSIFYNTNYGRYSTINPTIAIDTTESVMKFFIANGDTIFVDELVPAIVYNKPRGKQNKEWRLYYKLVYNFGKAYPYALLAKQEMDGTDEYIAKYHLKGRKKEKYVKSLEIKLFNKFEKPLRHFSFSQGHLLLRLIDRELGMTPYYLVKNYENGITAAFWQGIAKIFKSDMKKPYDKFGIDQQTEELVKIYKAGNFNYLYYNIFGKFPPEPEERAKKDYPQKFQP